MVTSKTANGEPIPDPPKRPEMSEYDKQVVSWLALHGFIVARKQLGFVVDCPTCGESWEIPHNDQLGVTEWRRLPQKIADRLT